MTEVTETYEPKTNGAKRAKDAVPSEPDELDILFPEVSVNTGKVRYIVSPFKFKDFKRVLELVKKYSGIVAAASEPDADLFNLIVENSEDGINDISEFIRFCCPITQKQLDDLRFDHVVDLFMTAVEGNRDFLLLRLQESGIRSSLVTSAATNGEILSAS
jgi:hypothetical protein